MKIGHWFSFLHRTRISLGDGYVIRWNLLEIKPLFSVYLNFWNAVAQDRFYMHAFNSISVMLRGWYYEETLGEDWPAYISAPLIRRIPRHHTHRIKRSSENAISLTLAGPWAKVWYEFWPEENRSRALTWGRKVLEEAKP